MKLNIPYLEKVQSCIKNIFWLNNDRNVIISKAEKVKIFRNFYSTSFIYGQKCILFNCKIKQPKITVKWYEYAVLDSNVS